MNTPDQPYEPYFGQEPEQAAPPPPPPIEPKKLTFWAKVMTRKFLFISIVAHVIFGLGATYYIVQAGSTKRKLTFQPGSTNSQASKKALEHKVSMAQKKKSGGAPPQAKR